MTEDGQLWYEFPEPEALTNIEWLQGLGLGYRDKYIQKMAENVAAGTIDLQRLADEEMTDGEIESYLKSIYGIGPKVANCIMLWRKCQDLEERQLNNTRLGRTVGAAPGSSSA